MGWWMLLSGILGRKMELVFMMAWALYIRRMVYYILGKFVDGDVCISAGLHSRR